MIAEPRARPLSETLRLALAAGDAIGVTRLGEVTQFAVPGIPVFQAVRPFARSLSVSQGKGATRMAAMVGALLESMELWAAETLAPPDFQTRLIELEPSDRALWHGKRDPLAISLDPMRQRHWFTGRDLTHGRDCRIPFDLISLDFTQPRFEIRVSSNGLAAGNTDTEAQASGVAELLEHHWNAWFDGLSPQEQLSRQLILSTVDDPALRTLMGRLRAAGFQLRAWSLADRDGAAAFRCLMTEMRRPLDDLCPSMGSGCHADKRIALARAMLEAVQSRATIFAGAREDLDSAAYARGREEEFGVLLRSLAFGEGNLAWQAVDSVESSDAARNLQTLLDVAEEIGGGVPIVGFEHRTPVSGLSLWHCLAPGLMDETRAPDESVVDRDRSTLSAPAPAPAPVPAQPRTNPPSSRRRVLFAGPSLHGLSVPEGIELRAPAACGDLAALLAEPPDVVGLVDGLFRTARTVWHIEILSLLAAGVRVIGGASLGAIRAAELADCGMEGIGAIYRAYRTRTILRDDAVLLLHAPAELGYAPLSLSQVDAEHALVGLAIEAGDRRRMQRIVRTTAYAERTWRQCLRDFETLAGRSFPIGLEELEHRSCLKRDDATAVIDALLAPSHGARARRPQPPRTFYHDALLADAHAGNPATLAAD